MARTYRITAGRHITTSPIGQARLLQNWFNDHKQGTVKEITDGIKGDLTTVQDPMKVVMFYMGWLGKKGIIEVVSGASPTTPPVKEEVPATPKVQKKVKPTKIHGLENAQNILKPTTEVTESRV